MSKATKELSMFDIEVTSWDERIGSMVTNYQHNLLVVDVDCQRNFVWDQKRSSRLIESILMDLPIPIFYCFETDMNSELIDGKQRFMSIFKFVNNEYKLKGLEIHTEYNGRYFKDLCPKVQQKINTYALHVYSIRSNDEASKYEIFNRLNTGGSKLKFDELVLGMHEGSITNFARGVSSKLIDSGLIKPEHNKHKRIDFSVLTQLLYTKENLISPVGKSKTTEIGAIFKNKDWEEALCEENVDSCAELLVNSYKLGRSVRELVWANTSKVKNNSSINVMMVYILSRIPLGLRYEPETLNKVSSLVVDAFASDENLITAFKVNTSKKDHRMMRQVVSDKVIAHVCAA